MEKVLFPFRHGGPHEGALLDGVVVREEGDVNADSSNRSVVGFFCFSQLWTAGNREEVAVGALSDKDGSYGVC
jgi:hypothetical protein